MKKSNEQLLNEIEISIEALVEENSSLKKEIKSLKANSPTEEIQLLKEKIAQLEEEKENLQKREEGYRDKLNKLKSLTDAFQKPDDSADENPLNGTLANSLLEKKQTNEEAKVSESEEESYSSEKKWDNEKYNNFFEKDADASKNQNNYNVLDSEKNPFAPEDTMLSDDEFSKNQ